MLSCVDQSVFCALGDQAALEMRNGAEDMEHQLTCGGRRVDPLLQADQVDLSRVEVIDRFQQLPERPAQAIEPDDGERIVRAGLVEQGSQTGSVERLA